MDETDRIEDRQSNDLHRAAAGFRSGSLFHYERSPRIGTDRGQERNVATIRGDFQVGLRQEDRASRSRLRPKYR